LIGFVLAGVAAFMSVEIKSLIVGEAASRVVQAGLREIIASETGATKPIRKIIEIRTMPHGPHDVLETASVDFHDGASAKTVEAVTAILQNAIKSRFPDVRHLFIEVQAEDTFAPAAVTLH
jgi:divalent metal cation (Fe/Co/Zn/Cd) transporter